MKMKLKPRILAVAEMVPPGSVVADIGTDHAYLPVFLVLEQGCPRVVAVEKSQQNAAIARETVARFQLEDRVQVRLGDGLQALRESDGIETVVLAGLGGKTICQLLGAVDPDYLRQGPRRLVLQPMGESAMLRRWLVAHGFRLVKERLARERKRYYEIMAAEPGRQKVDDPFMLELGPVLVQEEDPLLVPWLEKKLAHYEQIIQGLKRSGHGDNTARLRYYQWCRQQVKGVLENVGCRK